jgi:hypothetical protein
VKNLALIGVLFTACAQSQPCREGFVKNEGGNCVRANETGASADTSVEHDMDFGPACQSSETASADPITNLGVHDSITGQDGQEPPALIELVDLATDSDRSIIWGVGQGGLIGYSIADELAPLRIFTDPQVGGGRFHHVFAFPKSDQDKHWVYATHRSFGLVVFDTTDPVAPLASTRITEEGFEGMLQIEENFYVVSRTGELLTLDIQDLHNPTITHRSEVLGLPWTLMGDTSALYVADQELGLVVMNRTDPLRPAVEETHDLGGSVQALALNDSIVVAAAGSAGIQVFSRLDSLKLEWLATYAPGTSVQDLVLINDHLWAVTQESVLVVDLSNPANPKPLASRKTPYWAMAVDSHNGAAWVGDWGALRGYQLDETILAADIDPESTEILLNPDGESVTLEVKNRGPAPLLIDAITTENPDLELNYQGQLNLDPMEDLTLTIDWAGGDLDTTLCVRSNDPDEGLLRIKVRTTGGGQSSLGKMAPDFTLTDLSGKTHTLSEQQGHPVVLMYFATW